MLQVRQDFFSCHLDNSLALRSLSKSKSQTHQASNFWVESRTYGGQNWNLLKNIKETKSCLKMDLGINMHRETVRLKALLWYIMQIFLNTSLDLNFAWFSKEMRTNRGWTMFSMIFDSFVLNNAINEAKLRLNEVVTSIFIKHSIIAIKRTVSWCISIPRSIFSAFWSLDSIGWNMAKNRV